MHPCKERSGIGKALKKVYFVCSNCKWGPNRDPNRIFIKIEFSKRVTQEYYSIVYTIMETISKGKRNHHEMKTRAPPKGCGPSLNAFDLIAKELKEEF